MGVYVDIVVIIWWILDYVYNKIGLVLWIDLLLINYFCFCWLGIFGVESVLSDGSLGWIILRCDDCLIGGWSEWG